MVSAPTKRKLQGMPIVSEHELPAFILRWRNKTWAKCSGFHVKRRALVLPSCIG